MSTCDIEQQLADLIIRKSAEIPLSVEALACEHITDFIGTSLHGSSSSPVSQIIGHISCSSQGGKGMSRIWGLPLWAQTTDAALINAMAGHIDDFDDDDAEFSFSHPTVTIFTAAAAVGELNHISGAKLVRAYIAGVEFLMRFGLVVNPVHYAAGFHASATIGAISATVAAAYVLDLTAEQLRHALGIAASLAGGLRSNFGSDTKSLQTGNAARNAVLAASLAKDGFTSTPGSLLGPMGFVDVEVGKDANPLTSLFAFGETWLIDEPGITIKAYPCCTSSHTAVDSLRSLLQEHRFQSQDVEAIKVRIDPAVVRILIHDRPVTALEAKFSMPFCLGAILVKGQLGIHEFTDATVNELPIRQAMAKVIMVPDDTLPKTGGGVSLASCVDVHLRDGRILSSYRAFPSGSRSHRLSLSQLYEKFEANCQHILNDRCRRAFDDFIALPKCLDVHDLFASAFIPQSERA